MSQPFTPDGLMMASAVTQLSIVVMQDFSSHFARYFAAYNAALWFFVVTSMLLSVSPPQAAIGGEIALMVSAVWIWARPAFLLKVTKCNLQPPLSC